MNYLKQSTAFTDKLGPFLDSTNGDDEEPGLTIATADVRLSKNGGSGAAQDAGATAPAHDERSWYSINYTTTDTNTLGAFRAYIHVAGALPVWKDYTVLPAASFDALITNGLNNLGGTAQTADHTAAIADIPTVAEFNARTLSSASYFDFSVDKVTLASVIHTGAIIPIVNLVGVTIENTDMRGTNNANTTTPDNTGITANGVAIAALQDISVVQIFAGGDIDGLSLEESQKLIVAGAAGKTSGMETNTALIRAVDNSKTRITATVDGDGNRSSVTTDVTG